ncbi:Protein CBG16942 [Caenorhabditis briggsae]|uniref:Protein CBG16942 n=1 Tax=Caenorhabditis briggsae TaxID=6238 RepID=A8XQ41_CAEBR|nr:Protein CBG16942 [Caenorhabditis briggsae]CAP34766.1 Protein CBG16942 [Caenorhabditis briggsae]
MFTGYDQTNLVLLDRPQPPTHKAWCSNEHNSVLTINLAKNIKPISVSYQHSKWTHHIPMSTPRTYDVVACFDSKCQNWVLLVSNCEYSSQSIGTEQFCNVSSHLNVPLIGTVQFRFKENYGDSQMTCVSLVRVYGEPKPEINEEEEKSLESEEICTDLKYYYHNSYYFKYTLANKSCSTLYKNDCCSRLSRVL